MNLNDCFGFSDVSGTSTTRRERPWLRMNWCSQEEASLKLRRPPEQATNFFLLVQTQHNNIGGDSRGKWRRSILSFRATAASVSQSGTEESNSLPFHSNSLTHTTILSHTYYYSLLHKIYTVTHYYTLLHTLLFPLSHTTILSCINN